MLDQDKVNDLYIALEDKLTAEELCELLGLTVEDLFDKFTDEILEIDWDEVL